MAPPVNTTGATAIELGPLPNTIVQDVRDAGTTYTVWYKYTTIVGDKEIGIWAYGGLGTYEPILEVSLQDDGTPLYLGILSHNRPVQIPVSYPNTYYFKVTTNSAAADPALLTISGLYPPNEAVPAGSILMPDTSLGFPLVMISDSDGQPLKFYQNIVNGERKVALPAPNGKYLLEDGYFDQIAIYSNQLSLLDIVPFNIDGPHPVFSTDGVDTFYIGDPGGGISTAYVKRMSDTGVIDGSITWTLTGSNDILCIAVNRAETIIYYVKSFADCTILRWDMINNVALSDFKADVVGFHSAAEILILNDETILIAYVKDDGTDNKVKRFNAAGTLLNTYDFTTNYIGSIAVGIDDPDSFWVWQIPTGSSGISQFQHVRISDGAILANFQSSQFVVGVSQRDEAASMDRFGHDASACTSFGILVTQVAIGGEIVPNASSGIYFIDPGKTNDTLWTRFDPDETKTVKIP